MKYGRICTLLVIGLLAVLGAAGSRAETVRVDFAGTVVVANNGICQCLVGVSIGTPATGHYIYEYPSPDSNPSPNIGRYDYAQPGLGITVNVGIHVFTSDAAVDGGFSIELHDSVVDASGLHDLYFFRSYGGVDTVRNIPVNQTWIYLRDSTATALDSSGLMAVAPVLTDWTEDDDLVIFGDFFIRVDITSFSILTGVRSEPAFQAARLTGAYPNPFNPSIAIEYVVSDPETEIQITVHDVTGRVVRRLLEGMVAAGSYEVRWDGRDERGVEMVSGVYFVRMDVPGLVESRKIVLVK
ncbi:MAG: T9SS type A sorting domain-containing protein [Candidatus Krumholzibacteriota bacterium]|nr:T9SS type A sorting domain-containing protein [Candidatus Krumholzibacteriota bacterium]